MTVFFHLFAPQFYHLGGLTHDVGGSTGDNLDLTAGGEFHAGRAGADGLEKGRIGLLHRLGQHPEVIHIGELAVIGQFLFGPSPNHDVDGLGEPVPAGIYVDANPVKFLLLVPGSDAKIEPAAAHDVEHGHFLRPPGSGYATARL